MCFFFLKKSTTPTVSLSPNKQAFVLCHSRLLWVSVILLQPLLPTEPSFQPRRRLLNENKALPGTYVL